MSAGELTKSLEALVPQAKGVRWVVYAGAALLIVCVIGFCLWWLLVRPHQARVAAAAARVEAATSAATAGAAQDTVRIVVGHDEKVASIDAQTRSNDHAISAAVGAGDTIGADLDRVGRAALCMRDAYQSEPACAAMRGPGEGVGAAQADLGRFTPSGR